ncbi:MAG TPA: SEC-C metal-binding domain-containing protein, partial [Kofleriaceae bacterium]|nr:SEC-C metal-binding domain-containing protein [Kofleriaceae bacterium]
RSAGEAVAATATVGAAPAGAAPGAPAGPGPGPAADASLALDRASLEHLVAGAASCELERIRAAVERADYDDAAVRVLARAKLGLELPPDVATDVLIGVEHMEVFLAIARHASGGAAEPMLDLLRSGRLADDVFGAEQACYAAFVAWQLRPSLEAVRPVLVPRLRRLVRRTDVYLRVTGLTGWLAAQLADPHLTALFDEYAGRGGAKLAENVGRFALELWTAPLDEVIALLPERAPEQPIAGVPVRAAPKVGRNELCPCGSGKKFKRCCADRPVTGPIDTGASRAERLRAIEPRLEPKQIALLSRADLARLELGRLRDPALIEAMRRQAQLHDWRRALLAADEITRRHGKDFADDQLHDVLHEALHTRAYDAARRLVARLDEAATAEARMEIALAAHEPEALAQLEAAARAAVTDPLPGRAVDLAHAVLSALPALGILLGRGALRAGALLDGEYLLEAIEEARDELELPPGDPAEELFAALGGVHEKKLAAAKTEADRVQLARTAAGLRAELDEATSRLTALQRQMADHQLQLERAERAPADAGPRAARPADQEQERRELRRKLEELQALIRERNEERSELRRQLAAATESKSDAATAPEPPGRGREPEADDDDAEDLPDEAAARAVLIPRFTEAAAAAFEDVPRNVAAVAMRTVGALAAGEPAAWRGVKQAKDMARQVLMARVGIHHRLLFRADDGILDVLDLVTRESLMTTLKRLRSG